MASAFVLPCFTGRCCGARWRHPCLPGCDVRIRRAGRLRSSGAASSCWSIRWILEFAVFFLAGGLSKTAELNCMFCSPCIEASSLWFKQTKLPWALHKDITQQFIVFSFFPFVLRPFPHIACRMDWNSLDCHSGHGVRLQWYEHWQMLDHVAGEVSWIERWEGKTTISHNWRKGIWILDEVFVTRKSTKYQKKESKKPKTSKMETFLHLIFAQTFFGVSLLEFCCWCLLRWPCLAAPLCSFCWQARMFSQFCKKMLKSTYPSVIGSFWSLLSCYLYLGLGHQRISGWFLH